MKFIQIVLMLMYEISHKVFGDLHLLKNSVNFKYCFLRPVWNVILDFDFVYDRKSRLYSVITEGEFLAVGRFISTELEGDVELLKKFLAWLESTASNTKTFTEWTIEIDGDDVEVSQNQVLEMLNDSQQLEQQEATFDWEFQCSCGKQDLIKLLRAYISFKQ